MDSGLYPSNYFDYDDDDMAFQRETELVEAWAESRGAEPFSDPYFPADGRSLYFDPLYPPKGALPPDSLIWCRVLGAEIMGCDTPVTVAGDAGSPLISQGALGDGHLLGAMRLLACDIKNIKRLLVSERYADKGFYTFKFNKAGKWRYVHIDDRIPCRQSGRVHFCRNHNPNETFAMLMEKAYAKLHGCYESLVYGTVENTLRDLTPAANVSTIKCDSIPPEGAYNAIWRVMEQAMEDGKAVSCGRYVQDPYNDSVEARRGVDLGFPYQVVDVCSAKSLPTENLDAMHVAMVLVRVLQPPGKGLFTGRWSRGHSLWVDYPDIGKDLFVRTQEVLLQLGLSDEKKPLPADDPSEAGSQAAGSVKKAGSGSVASKRTAASGSAAESASRDQSEPSAAPDAFADVRLQLDPSDGEEEPDNMSKERRPKNRATVVEPDCEFLCWIQFEDFVEVFNRVFILDDLSWSPGYATKRFPSTWVAGDYVAGSGGPPSEFLFQDADDALFGSPRGGRRGSSAKSSLRGPGRAGLSGGESKEGSLGDDDDDDDEDEESDEEEQEGGDPFTDNPMYPFSVTEPTHLSVALFQADKRWSAARVGDDPLDICVHDFAVRGGRSAACMQYPEAIGFVVLRLSGLKMRVTTFKRKKIAGTSFGIVHSNVSTNHIHLLPGRYAIVPFTHRILPYSQEYTLFAQFKKGAVEFEITDIIKERPIDQVLSEDEEGEAAASPEGKAPAAAEPAFGIPEEAPDEPWIWREDAEEQGILSIYEQVGDLAQQMRRLRAHIKEMDLELLELKTRAAEAEKAAKENEEEQQYRMMSIR